MLRLLNRGLICGDGGSLCKFRLLQELLCFFAVLAVGVILHHFRVVCLGICKIAKLALSLSAVPSRHQGFQGRAPGLPESAKVPPSSFSDRDRSRPRSRLLPRSPDDWAPALCPVFQAFRRRVEFLNRQFPADLNSSRYRMTTKNRGSDHRGCESGPYRRRANS